MSEAAERARVQMPKSGTAKSAVLLLHGLGSNADDLISLAPYWADALPDTVFVSPNAPEPCDMAPYGFQWFSLRDWTEASMLEGAARAASALETIITRLQQNFHIPASKTALVGFSQGTMMALHVGLRRTEPLAAIVGFSGALVGINVLKSEIKSRPPVLLVHGMMDPVVPFAALQTAAASLNENEVPVETLACPALAHSIDEAGLQRAQEFLKKHLL